jgi:rhodanese-related sulfurtransferase
MQNIPTISVHELKDKLASGATLLDVREFAEYAGAHIPNSQLVPLGEVCKNPQSAAREGEVFVLCRSGKRAQQAAAQLAQVPGCRPVVVEGGIEAWKGAGYPVERQKGPMALERQVRIAAGSLVLIGLLVPGARFISYFVGCGLVFAGVTDKCGMALLLAKLPWNKAPVHCPLQPKDQPSG